MESQYGKRALVETSHVHCQVVVHLTAVWECACRGPPKYWPGTQGTGGDSLDVPAFSMKFLQTAKKIVRKMQSNAQLIVDQTKRTVDELSGRGGRDPPNR